MVENELTGRPLRDTARDRRLFVDREATLDVAQRALRNERNVLLDGGRGSGKTSLLYFLQHRLDHDGLRTAVVQGRAAASLSDFFALLRDSLGAEREQPTEATWVPPPLVRTPRTDTQLILDELSHLREILPAAQTIVLVDEMPSPQTAHTLFGRLRDELWELPLTWFVATDERDRASYVEPPAEAFWGRLLSLPPLTSSEAVELLERRLGSVLLDSEVLAQVVEQASGNPRRLISLATEIVNGDHDPETVLEKRRKRDGQIETLTDSSRRLLAELEANGPASPSDEGLLKRLGWSRSRAAQVFKDLERHGLVRSSERAGTGRRPRRVFDLVAP
jgi:hypothetical protein